jgi:hypothetical protein
MKKILAIAIASTICASSVDARTLSCNYNDTLYVTNATAPSNTHIMGPISSSGDVNVINDSPSSFTIQGFCKTTNQGSVEVTFGTSADNVCTLDIDDGEFFQDPVVKKINCKGNLSYSGITYDGIFTYHYKLYFSQK